ncbi:cystatin 11 [Rattus norvegicus]|uniref:Cystatin-11 n=2 Tax=Rattus norvegicus TaxID=10116 RepID=CST11_RAT|nr:cystatin-11 precursor [Rattus norvegicus]Q8K5A3.1 RecName: Full=Cystatin-11; Flags: Precursor [Rattus norvegicus]AAM21709.1 cystatin 11 [Rattus norvegicus]EDL95091.1 cystatin 11 [Rattus norvegicus]|eukprot:NP_620785.1 cystatin-11 precursor [Rattus norvegicus]
MMARLWKTTWFLLAILVALVAFSYQVKRKTFIRVEEVNALESSVKETLEYVTEEYNKKSEDLYNFRILRILKIEKQMTNHMEFHITVEMQRTTCLKTEKNLCNVQEGELHKQIQCYFSVYVIPWLEVFKMLKKNCTNSS